MESFALNALNTSLDHPFSVCLKEIWWYMDLILLICPQAHLLCRPFQFLKLTMEFISLGAICHAVLVFYLQYQTKIISNGKIGISQFKCWRNLTNKCQIQEYQRNNYLLPKHASWSIMWFHWKNISFLRPGFKPQIYHLWAPWPWENNNLITLVVLCLKMGITLNLIQLSVKVKWDYAEDVPGTVPSNGKC